jgi:hypothetical protein
LILSKEIWNLADGSVCAVLGMIMSGDLCIKGDASEERKRILFLY